MQSATPWSLSPITSSQVVSEQCLTALHWQSLTLINKTAFSISRMKRPHHCRQRFQPPNVSYSPHFLSVFFAFFLSHFQSFRQFERFEILSFISRKEIQNTRCWEQHWRLDTIYLPQKTRYQLASHFHISELPFQLNVLRQRAGLCGS
jgi:hypothetical protein